MAVGYNPRIVTDGLLFINKKTWNDLSGNDNDGTLTNGPTYNNGGYLDFDLMIM